MNIGTMMEVYMGGCQNYGPFLGPYNITGLNTGPNLGDPKRDHHFDNPPYGDFIGIIIAIHSPTPLSTSKPGLGISFPASSSSMESSSASARWNSVAWHRPQVVRAFFLMSQSCFPQGSAPVAHTGNHLRQHVFCRHEIVELV